MKRAFIVHCWGGRPDDFWYPWLKDELERRGFQVTVPEMSPPVDPAIPEWVAHLATAVGTPDRDTYFIGHSVGCQTILRYLESVRGPVGGTVCVAGWFVASDLETEHERQVAEQWLTTPIDFAKVRRACPNVAAILSDDDPFVPVEDNRRIFAEKLGATVTVEHDRKHFGGGDDSGITELPGALAAVVALAGSQ